MNDKRIVGGSSFGAKDGRAGGTVKGVRSESVDSLCRKHDESAGSKNAPGCRRIGGGKVRGGSVSIH